ERGYAEPAAVLLALLDDIRDDAVQPLRGLTRECGGHAANARCVEPLEDVVRDAAERERRRRLLRLIERRQAQHAFYQEEERAARVRLELTRGPHVLGTIARAQLVEHDGVANDAVPHAESARLGA